MEPPSISAADEAPRCVPEDQRAAERREQYRDAVSGSLTEHYRADRDA